MNLIELKSCAGITDAGTEPLPVLFGRGAALQKAADLANLANLIRLRIEKAAA